MTKDEKKNVRKKVDTAREGSVLILALIMASILLSVGMGISGIAIKELKLSSIGDESGKAFYMADIGAECALYWDHVSPAVVENITDPGKKQYVFATSSGSLPNLVTSNSGIKCFNGFDITSATLGGEESKTDTGNSPDRATTTFWLKDSGGAITKPCAEVTVAKVDTGVDGFSTTIDSRGRSSCDPANPRRVERGLKVSY